ncbi:hypothetical protein [Chitinibacter sp. GC72]|uniref:hypothetical protein n=1 Tax=Chitinibacter sp. GC72 TaxID=1526917 RepID=UPI0012FA216F|nr:hypothetical protein [Chitinibacter sp. GC72]
MDEMPTINPLPPVPARTDDGDVFSDKANVFVAALVPWTTQINALASYLSGAFTTAMTALKNAAAGSASAASASELAAAGSASAAAQSKDQALAYKNTAEAAAAAAQSAAGLPSLTGNAGKALVVNAAGDGVEFSFPYAAAANVPSAATTNIGATTTENITITGTTTISSFGVANAGLRRVLRFTSALTLVRNATSLILPNPGNLAVAAGDTMEVVSLGSGNWLCLWYQPVKGVVTTDIGFGAVGSFALCCWNGASTTLAAGSVVAGSSLLTVELNQDQIFPSGASFSGTWRLLNAIRPSYQFALAQRIA